MEDQTIRPFGGSARCPVVGLKLAQAGGAWRPPVAEIVRQAAAAQVPARGHCQVSSLLQLRDAFVSKAFEGTALVSIAFAGMALVSMALPSGANAQGCPTPAPRCAEARALAESLPTEARAVLEANLRVRAQAHRCVQMMLEHRAEAGNVSPPSGLPPADAFAGAWCLAVQGWYPSAIEWAAAGARLLPGQAVELLHRIGVLALLDGAPLLSERAIGRALRVRPRDAHLHSELGGLQLARGEAADAARTFRRGVEAAPGDIALRMDLASALVALGRPEQALIALRQVVASEPNSGEAWLLLARAALDADEQAVAEHAAERAVASLGSEDPRGLVALGAARMTLGNTLGAARAFGRALRRAPEDLAARVALAGLHAASGVPPSVSDQAGPAAALATP